MADMNKVRDKYLQKMIFFDSKDVLDENHIRLFVKGLSGIRTFIVDNSEMFEPVAIEWLASYCSCRPKFNKTAFQNSLFSTTPIIIKILTMEHTSTSFVNDFAESFFEILSHVPEEILAQIFWGQKTIFKLLSSKIFNCGIYSNQITLLEILFRFFSTYRNYKFDDDDVQNSQDVLSNQLFPNNKIKNELTIIFLNMDKITFDTDSRMFLNKLNRSVEPCKIFSIVAESIIRNGNQLTAPILSNQSYQFWIDFNINILQICFPCNGEANGWMTNYIAMEDLIKLTVERNSTHMHLSLTIKNSDLNSLVSKIDLDLIRYQFQFILNGDSAYMEKHVLPYYQSYLNSSINGQIPSKYQRRLRNDSQEIQDPGEQELRAEIIKYSKSAMNSFTFEQSISRSSTICPIDYNIFNNLAPKCVLEKRTMEIKSPKNIIKPQVLLSITNKIVNTTPAKNEKLDNNRKRDPVGKVARKGKKELPNKCNSQFDQLKSNDKTTTNTKRKLYSKKVIEEGIKTYQNIKPNKQRKREKSRKEKKLINRVVPIQTVTGRKQSNVRNLDYTSNEIMQIRANVEIINSGLQNSVDTVISATDENDNSAVSNLPVVENIQPITNNSPSVYDFRNISRVETRDDEFISNVITQVRSQQAVQQKQTNTNINNNDLKSIQSLLTPSSKLNETDDNKNVTHSYRRYTKTKNTSTKLGYNSNIDCIQPYNESHFAKSSQQPTRVQGFRQSKAKINNFCEISSDEDVPITPQIENIVVAEVHLAEPRDDQIIENNLFKLPNKVVNKSHIETHVISNTLPNVTVITTKQGETPKQIISIPTKQTTPQVENLVVHENSSVCSDKLIENNLSRVSQGKSNYPHKLPNNSVIKQTEKQDKELSHIISKPKSSKPITIPMPIPILEEIKTEYIISVDDESDYEIIDCNSQAVTQQIPKANNFNSLPMQTHSKVNKTLSERSSKRKCSETEDESEKESESHESPKQKTPKQKSSKTRIVDHEISELVTMNSKNDFNNCGKNMIMVKSSSNINRSRMVSCSRNDSIRHDIDSELAVNRQNGSEYMSDGQQCVLQVLIDKFNHTLKTEMSEIHTEFQNIKKSRLDQDKSLSVIIESKKQKLSDKLTNINLLFSRINDQEMELKMTYTNLLKKIEKLTKRISKTRTEIGQQENDIDQIKRVERDLANQLIKIIKEGAENIRDEMWTQFVVEFGNSMQQHFLNRFL